MKSCFYALCTLFFLSSVSLRRLRTFRSEVLDFRARAVQRNMENFSTPIKQLERSAVINTSSTRIPFQRLRKKFYLAAQRCKVVYKCSSSFVSQVSFCGTGLKPLLLVKVVDGELYIGMRDQNKYVKECVKRNLRRGSFV